MEKKQYETPAIEKVTFALSDESLCSGAGALASGTSTDGGVYTPTDKQSNSATGR